MCSIILAAYGFVASQGIKGKSQKAAPNWAPNPLDRDPRAVARPAGLAPIPAFLTHCKRHGTYISNGFFPLYRKIFHSHLANAMDSSSNNTPSAILATQTEQAPGNTPSHLLPSIPGPPQLRILTCLPVSQHKTQLTVAALEARPQLATLGEPSAMLQRYLDQGKWEEPWAAGYSKDG